jgi:hypothetical protein
MEDHMPRGSHRASSTSSQKELGDERVAAKTDGVAPDAEEGRSRHWRDILRGNALSGKTQRGMHGRHLTMIGKSLIHAV